MPKIVSATWEPLSKVFQIPETNFSLSHIVIITNIFLIIIIIIIVIIIIIIIISYLLATFLKLCSGPR